MRLAPIFNIKVPLESRIDFLVEEYGQLDQEFLVECTTRIGKRLGPEQTKNAVLAINEGRMADFIRLVLVYYDKTYKTGLSKRSPEKVYTLESPGNDAKKNAELIINSLHIFTGVILNIH
jgi:tRNA 2-selenouridine synthase